MLTSTLKAGTSRALRTVTEMGRNGMKNGILLQNAAHSFDVFLTADQNIQYQQNLEALPGACPR
jgi:hypothetical protein